MTRSTPYFGLWLILAASCGGPNEQTPSAPSPHVASVQSLTVSIDVSELASGESRPLTASAAYDDGSVKDITSSFAFASSNEQVIRIERPEGEAPRLVASGPGTATVELTFESASSRFEVTVLPARAVHIQVEPSAIRLGPGQTRQLSAKSTFTDSTERDVTTEVTWTSSDPSVIEIDARGLARALKLGSVNITAAFQAKEAAAEASVVCTFPADAGRIEMGEVVPAIEWRGAYNPDGGRVDVGLLGFYCGDLSWGEIKTVHFVVSAGWCPNCPSYLKRVAQLAGRIESAGGLVVFVDIETANRRPATNEDAQREISRHVGTAPSLRVGDADTMPIRQIFGRAVDAVPGAFIVRTRDMRVVASQAESRTVLDFVGIANDPEQF